MYKRRKGFIFQRKYNDFYKENDYMVCAYEGTRLFIFDKDDFEKIKDYFWSLDKNGKPVTHIKRKQYMLSRIITGISDSKKKILLRGGAKDDYRKSNLFAGNIYTEFDNYYEGECYDGQKFKIDKEDFELIKPYTWHVDRNGYVITKIDEEIFKQHRMILGLSKTDKCEVDHIHHDQLDNRKSELRIVNRFQNTQNTRISIANTSGVKGVYKMSGYDDKWCVQISCNGVKHYIGSFDNFDEAVTARHKAEQELHGEYACNEK